MLPNATDQTLDVHKVRFRPRKALWRQNSIKQRPHFFILQNLFAGMQKHLLCSSTLKCHFL